MLTAMIGQDLIDERQMTEAVHAFQDTDPYRRDKTLHYMSEVWNNKVEEAAALLREKLRKGNV